MENRVGDNAPPAAEMAALGSQITAMKVPTSRMMADLDLSIALTPLVTDLKAAARLAEDTQSQAFSEAWQAFLILYGTLLKIAEDDPDLASEMEDVVEFMAIYGKRKPSAEEPESPA